ncbi:MAG: hypothetical protein AAF614_29270, partial [Chloroflexota bacterium]
MMKRVDLPFGERFLTLEVDDEALGEVVVPQETTAVFDDPTAAIQQALANPIGTPRLGEIVSAGQTHPDQHQWHSLQSPLVQWRSLLAQRHYTAMGQTQEPV